jgi:hypothetical protein
MTKEEKEDQSCMLRYCIIYKIYIKMPNTTKPGYFSAQSSFSGGGLSPFTIILPDDLYNSHPYLEGAYNVPCIHHIKMMKTSPLYLDTIQPIFDKH